MSDHGTPEGKLDNDGPYVARHPFSDLPPEALRRAALELAKRDAAGYETCLQGLMALVRGCEPTVALSSIALYGLTMGRPDTTAGDARKNRKPQDREVTQAHVELLQAAFLTIPAGERCDRPATPPEIQDMIEKLRDTAKAFAQLRIVHALETIGTGPADAALVQERIRTHTQFVRNWGYFSQVIDILQRLYGPLDERCHRAIGISATQLIEVFRWMTVTMEKRATWFTQGLRRAYSASTPEERYVAYVTSFGAAPGSAEEFSRLSTERGLSQEQQMAILLRHAGLLVPSIYTFTAKELASAVDADESDVRAALAGFSLMQGDLQDMPLERLFMANPVWQKPLLKVGPNQFFCCMPQMFFSFSFPIMDAVFSSSPEAKVAHARRRSVFLEQEITTILSRVFGEQAVHAGVKWSIGGREYETDLLIHVDTRLFIIEAKSHRVSPTALRGAPDRIRRHVKELFIEPAVQSMRLKDAIMAARAGTAQDFKLGCSLDLRKVREITRLSVTLEDFAQIQSNLTQLGGDLSLPAGVDPPVTMSVADLHSVIDVLENPIEVIYYLVMRDRLQGTTRYLADELDLLGIYLSTGFCLGEIEAGQASLTAVGMSKVVDDYFLFIDNGLSPDEKPKRRYTPWFRAIRDRLYSRKAERWSEVAEVVLGFSFDDQQQIEDKLTALRASMRAGELDPHSGTPVNTVTASPPTWRDLGLAIVLLDTPDFQRRHELMTGAAQNLLEDCHVRRCVVLALRLHNENLPFAAVMLADREDFVDDSPS